MVYVMSDLHGRYNEFLEMLKLINFEDDDFLYILGDITDRRENGIKLLKVIMDKPNMKVLRGNHELMMYESCILNEEDRRKNEMYICWMQHGGTYTLKEFELEEEEEKEKILDFIKNLDDYELLEVNNNKYLLIHAGIYIPEGVSVPKDVSLDSIIRYNIRENIHLWIREDFLDVYEYIEDCTVVFGHTPTRYIPDFMGYVTPKMNIEDKRKCFEGKIYHGKNKIGIDCEQNLACLRLDDLKEFYVKNEI